MGWRDETLTVVVISCNKHFPIFTHENRMLITRSHTHNPLAFQKTDFREGFSQGTIALSKFPIGVLSTCPHM